MIVTVIHDPTSDAFEVPIIDIDAHEQMDGWGTRAIRYTFEFDISGESHSMSQFDPVGVVVSNGAQDTVTTVDGEITAVGKHVLVVELNLVSNGSDLTDILNDADDWTNERVQDSADAVVASQTNGDATGSITVSFKSCDGCEAMGDIWDLWEGTIFTITTKEAAEQQMKDCMHPGLHSFGFNCMYDDVEELDENRESLIVT